MFRSGALNTITESRSSSGFSFASKDYSVFTTTQNNIKKLNVCNKWLYICLNRKKANKMFKHNLTPTLNLQRSTKENKHALRVRATIKRKVSYYPTGIMLLKEEWDVDTKKIILHANRNLLNAELSRIMAGLEKEFVEQNLSGEIAPVILSKKSRDFYKYIDEKIKYNKPNRSKSTTKHHISYLKKVKEFKATCLFSEINEKLLNKFEEFCKIKKENNNNGIWSSTKFLKTYIHAAMREGLIKEDPIKNFEGASYVEPGRSWLTATEIERVEAVSVDEEIYGLYRNAANWFLFSCYSGLRYSDAFLFKKESIETGRIIIKTEKNGENVTILVHPKLSAVLERISGKLTSNQDYNRNLKGVATAAKITKPMTSHIARHTFAVQFLDRGGSMEVLSKLLGHSSMKTTQIYGKIINRRIDAEMEKVWG